MSIFQAMVTGVFTGAAWSVVGYLRRRSDSGDSFDVSKLADTVLVGAVLGLLVFVLPVPAPSGLEPLVVDAALTGGLLPYAKKFYSSVLSYFK